MSQHDEQANWEGRQDARKRSLVVPQKSAIDVFQNATGSISVIESDRHDVHGIVCIHLEDVDAVCKAIKAAAEG